MPNELKPTNGAAIPSTGSMPNINVQFECLPTAEILAWPLPEGIQRLLSVNEKVRLVAKEIAATGLMPGVVTLGNLDGVSYLLDGQHRRAALELSGLQQVWICIRTINYESVEQMARDFVKLNSQLVSLRPDDILRPLEKTTPELAQIRAACPFIGYGRATRGARRDGVTLSMSMAIRCWLRARMHTPGGHGGGTPSRKDNASAALVHALVHGQDGPAEIKAMIDFYNTLAAAWGHDPEYQSLWGAFNLTMCAWIWRRTVMNRYSARSIVMTVQEFQRCAMTLTSDERYLDWLVGKGVTDKTRSPGYGRICNNMTKRYMQIHNITKRANVRWPKPEWANAVRESVTSPRHKTDTVDAPESPFVPEGEADPEMLAATTPEMGAESALDSDDMDLTDFAPGTLRRLV